MMRYIPLVAMAVLLTSNTALRADSELSIYGSSRTDLHQYPVIDTVFDVNYSRPEDLNLLYGFVKSTIPSLKGKTVVVTHGPELRAFAKENYIKYQGIMDRMKELADAGVEFRMCHSALRAAGFKADDFHGFVTVVPSGFPEIALLQSQGYRYLNPLPYAVGDVRYLDQPQLKPSK